MLALDLKNMLNNYPLYIFFRFLIIIPIYQIILIVIASIFGEFQYFWRFEKKFLNVLKLLNNLKLNNFNCRHIKIYN